MNLSDISFFRFYLTCIQIHSHCNYFTKCLGSQRQNCLCSNRNKIEEFASDKTSIESEVILISFSNGQMEEITTQNHRENASKLRVNEGRLRRTIRKSVT